MPQKNMSDGERDYESDDIDADEDEIDDQLALPDELKSISLEEKKSLLRFKLSHSEREWEEELLRRTDAIERKLDYERLKQMMGSKTEADPKASFHSKRGKRIAEIEAGPTSKKPSTKARTDREMQIQSDDEGEADDTHFGRSEDSDEEHNKLSQMEEDDEDDDLFDSAEEEEITKRVRNKDSGNNESLEIAGSSYNRPKILGKRKAASKSKRSKVSDSSNEDYDDDDEKEDENDDDLFEGHEGNNDFNLQSIKDNHRKPSNDSKAQSERSRFSKPKVFGSISEYRKFLEKQNREQELPQEDDDNEKPELQDFIKITLRRDYLISLLGEPFFEKYVKGCYVKYSVGVDDDKPVYRICQIIGIEESASAYKLPPNTINPQITNTTKKLILHFGEMEKRNQRIDRVSNHTITQAELDAYLKVLDEQSPQTDPSPVATKRDVRVIRNDQKKLRNYVYSHEEIKSMVKNKLGYNKVLTTEYSTAMESLYKKREEALKANDTDYLEAINKNIRLLEAENERQKKIFERTFKKQLEVNRRMKEGNVRRDMAAGMRKRQEDQEAIAKGVMSSAVLDPFIRRETRPKILWNTSEALMKQKELEDGKKENTLAAAAKANVPAKIASSADAEHLVLSDELTVDEVRKRIRSRLGVDPFEESRLSKRDRYLKRVCKRLPTNPEERERLRGRNKSLSEYIAQMDAIKPA